MMSNVLTMMLCSQLAFQPYYDEVMAKTNGAFLK